MRAATETLTSDHVVKERSFSCPLYIGCNRVGGNWGDYDLMLCSVAEECKWSFSLNGLAGDEEFMCPYCKHLFSLSLWRQHVGSGRSCGGTLFTRYASYADMRLCLTFVDAPVRSQP